MKKTISYNITEKNHNQTIGAFLKEKGYSRKLLIHLKQTAEGLRIGSDYVHMPRRLNAGDRLTIRLEEASSYEKIPPIQLPLSILYEDEDLLIINKDAGVPVHPSQGNYGNTVANGLAWHYRQLGEPFICRTINRLDKDTTGLLIVAKNQLSSCLLSEQVRQRKIHRQYLAIAAGKVKDGGMIDAPIARREESVIERCVDFEQGVWAKTHFRLVSYSSALDCSLVSLRLETGRTHQIRVHMKHIGHPILGDFLYHPDYRLIRRQALHSFRLDFIHPLTEKNCSFYAPLPDDMTFFQPAMWNSFPNTVSGITPDFFTAIEDLWGNDF